MQADCYNHLLRRVNLASSLVTNLAGSPSRLLGHADGIGTAASFFYPSGVAVDDVGTIAVIVRKIVLRRGRMMLRDDTATEFIFRLPLLRPYFL